MRRDCAVLGQTCGTGEISPPLGVGNSDDEHRTDDVQRDLPLRKADGFVSRCIGDDMIIVPVRGVVAVVPALAPVEMPVTP